jgi:hypothetical protein
MLPDFLTNFGGMVSTEERSLNYICVPGRAETASLEIVISELTQNSELYKFSVYIRFVF